MEPLLFHYKQFDIRINILPTGNEWSWSAIIRNMKNLGKFTDTEISSEYHFETEQAAIDNAIVNAKMLIDI